MVSNPSLVQATLLRLLADFRKWIALPDETSHLNVAIFYDARAVAGDTRLLTKAKTALVEMVRGEQTFLRPLRTCNIGAPSPHRSVCSRA